MPPRERPERGVVRIIQLANFYGPASGGLRTAVDAVGRGYADGGFERVLVVPGERDHDATDAAGRVITMASPRLPGGSGYRAITDLAKLRALLDAIGPDRVEVSDKLTLTGLGRWAARRGIPSVLWSHERLDAILSPRVPRPIPLRRAADHWNRWLARSFDAIVCSSDFAASEWERAGVHDAVRIPLGVDLSLFHPEARAGRAPETDGEVRLVCVGRLSREKHPELAIETLRALIRSGVPAQLSMVGEGPQRDDLAARAQDLPVRFTGHVGERVGVAALLAQADVAIVPCPYETFGLSALEAMACGTPVVVPDAGAARELLVRAPVGIASAPEPDRFAAAVRAVLGTPAAERRAAARRRAEAYPWSRTMAAMRALHVGLGADRERKVS